MSKLRLNFWKRDDVMPAAQRPPPLQPNSTGAPASDSPLIAAANDFGFRLLAELHMASPTANLFLSPASIAIALTMTYNGAQGETQRAMAETLGLAGLTTEAVNAAYATFVTGLNALDPKVRLALANSLWVDIREVLRPEFVAQNRTTFRAELANLDFGKADEAARTINAWVEGKTENKIKDLLAPLNVLNAALVLVNAIYFKGAWQREFDKAETREGCFTLLDATTKRLAMMHQSGEYRYHEDDTAQVIELPYGEGRVGMIIVLPRKDVDFNLFRGSLDAARLEHWAANLWPVDGDIILPRFKVAYKKELNDALGALGMGIAFGERADFGGIMPGPLFISLVIHQAFMDVNEEGTEAAAATAVVMARGLPMDRFHMVVDRPFFCAIRDHATGANLFMGWVTDPQNT